MKTQLKKEQKQSKSVILKWLAIFTEWFYVSASTGFFGRFFNSYSKLSSKLKNGFASSIIGSSSKLGKAVRKGRFVIAEQFETSGILLLFRKLIRFLVGCKLRFYGAFLGTAGIYTVLVYFLKEYILIDSEGDVSYVVLGIVFVLLAIPLLISPKNFAQAVMSSRSGYFIASNILGISDEKLIVNTSKLGESYNLAILVGILSGVLAFFVNPMYIIAVIAVIVFVVLIMSTPEVGVVCVIALLPMLATKASWVLLLMVSLYSFSYVIKLLRGKRVLNFSPTDIFLLFLSLMMLSSGFVSFDNTVSAKFKAIAFIVLIFGCFVTGSIIRTKAWQKRCNMSFIYSGLILSLLTIWQNAAAWSQNFSQVSFTFKNIHRFPFFGNRDHLMLFLSVALMFAVSAIFYNETAKRQKLIYTFISLMIATALMVSGSVRLCIGTVIALLVFFMIMSKKTVPIMAFVVIIAPTVAILVQWWLGVNVLNVLSEHAYSTVRIWQGTLAALSKTWFTGIGIGGFPELYPIYAAAGFEEVQNTASAWLRLLCDVGVVGLLLALGVLVMFVMNCLEFVRKKISREAKAIVAAGLCTVIGLSVQAVFCDFFSSGTLCYVFFGVICITNAVIRTGRVDLEKSEMCFENTEYAATVDVLPM